MQQPQPVADRARPRRGVRRGGAARVSGPRSVRPRARRGARRAAGCCARSGSVRSRRSTAAAGSTSASARASAWSRSTRPGASSSPSTDPAGGQVLLVDLVEELVDGAPDQAAPGELVDADGHVEAGVVLGAGGVRRAGGQVHGEPGSEQHVVDPAVVCVVPVVAGPLAARVVHLPLLGAMGLEDEHVVAVAVHREALRAGRREVGVGLAGMAELELEPGDQVGQRRVVAVQPLEDDGRAVGEERRGPCGGRRGRSAGRPAIDAPRRTYADSPSTLPSCATRMAGVRIALPVSRSSASSSESTADQRGRVGLVQVHQGRPDLRDEGLGVTAEQVQRRGGLAQSAVPSVPSASPPSVPSPSEASPSVPSVPSPSVPSASPPSVPSASPPAGHRVAPGAGDVAVVQRGVEVFVGHAVLLGRNRSSGNCLILCQSSAAPQRRQAPVRVTPRRAARSVDQAASTGDRGRLGAAGGAQLAEDVGDVDAHRLGADEELLADLTVGPAGRDELEDLGLPRCEQVGARLVAGRRRADRPELLDQRLSRPVRRAASRAWSPTRGPRRRHRWHAAPRPAPPGRAPARRRHRTASKSSTTSRQPRQQRPQRRGVVGAGTASAPGCSSASRRASHARPSGPHDLLGSA